MLVTREGYLGVGVVGDVHTYVVWVSEWREERKTKVNEKWPLTSTKTKRSTTFLLQCFFYVYVCCSTYNSSTHITFSRISPFAFSMCGYIRVGTIETHYAIEIASSSVKDNPNVWWW